MTETCVATWVHSPLSLNPKPENLTLNRNMHPVRHYLEIRILLILEKMTASWVVGTIGVVRV